MAVCNKHYIGLAAGSQDLRLYMGQIQVEFPAFQEAKDSGLHNFVPSLRTEVRIIQLGI